MTSPLTPNRIDTAGNVGEKGDDTNEALMVVNSSKTVIPKFFTD